MTDKGIYKSTKQLWKGRLCQHTGCEAWATGQCESWEGSAFEGNVCAKPICTDHTFHLAGLPVCRTHIKKLAAPVETHNAEQIPLF